jgi:hypothetical protein
MLPYLTAALDMPSRAENGILRPGSTTTGLDTTIPHRGGSDPLVDWLPWLPDPAFPLDVSCGGHYLNGASSWTVLLGWVLVAVPVWAGTLALFRWTQKDPWLRV